MKARPLLLSLAIALAVTLVVSGLFCAQWADLNDGPHANIRVFPLSGLTGHDYSRVTFWLWVANCALVLPANWVFAGCFVWLAGGWRATRGWDLAVRLLAAVLALLLGACLNFMMLAGHSVY